MLLRPRLLIGLCTALVIAAGAGLAVVSTSDHHASPTVQVPSTHGSSGSGPGAPSVQAVQAMLDRHGAAVVHRDREAFVGDLGTSAAASAYRAEQEAMFANLARVPLAAWTYRVSAPVTGGSVLDAAATRYHAPVLIARVALGYQLHGADPAPTEHDLWLTFVRRSGQVRVAGDSDLADQGGQSWRGPWDFGPVSVYRGGACLILAHEGFVTQLAGLASVVDDAVAAVTRVWGTGWARHVVVIVPDSEDELRAVVGGPGGTDVAADTVADQDDPHTGLRVVLDPAGLTRLSDLGLRIVVRHEITHVATWPLSTDVMPTWLVEGFADYVGNLGTGQPVGVAASELRAEVRAGRVPAALPARDDFTRGGARAPVVYEEGWLACRLIATMAGQRGLVRFYRKVAGSTGAPDAAVGLALRDVVHLSLGQFTARWRAYLRAELR